MTIKKSPAARPERRRAENYGGTPDTQPGAADRYVQHLVESMGAYAKPAREARRIVDESAGSLTDALYEIRRDGLK
ncbi:MAG: hypothetical protein ACRD3C_15145 [Vicinamibacterales bacterium]